MLCPSCNGPLSREPLEGETVDRCPSCRGIWFDETELGHVVRRAAAPSLTGAETRRGAAGLACPNCRAPMTLVSYAYDSGVLVNKCPACAGVWLEDGQLALIAQYRTGKPADRALAEALAGEMRAANRWRRVRGLLRSRVLSGTVAFVYVLVAVIMTGDGGSVLGLVLFLLLPLACIWFSDGLGKLVGISLGLGRPTITQETPGDLVAIGGWLLLLTPAVMAVIVRA